MSYSLIVRGGSSAEVLAAAAARMEGEPAKDDALDNAQRQLARLRAPRQNEEIVLSISGGAAMEQQPQGDGTDLEVVGALSHNCTAYIDAKAA